LQLKSTDAKPDFEVRKGVSIVSVNFIWAFDVQPEDCMLKMPWGLISSKFH